MMDSPDPVSSNQINSSTFRILVFNWNHQGVRIGESLDLDELDSHRESYTSGYLYDYQLADFLPQIMNRVQRVKPHLFVFGSQEDASPGSYLHSHLLIQELQKIGYSLLERTRLMGVGRVSVKALQQGDLKLRGIRLSVYCHQTILPAMLQARQQLEKKFQDLAAAGSIESASLVQEYVSNSLTRNKGASCCYLPLPTGKVLALICAHLPHDSKSLLETKERDDTLVRQTAIQHINICFNYIYQKFVTQIPLVSSVLYLGDLNYRLPGQTQELNQLTNPNLLHQLYLERDELYAQMRIGNIYSLEEGVANRGPEFLPTCKMRHDRFNFGRIDQQKTCRDSTGIDQQKTEKLETSQLYNLGKRGQRFPSWADRILYKSLDHSSRLDCLEYDSLDYPGVMSLSDHQMVYGLFQLAGR